jgi:hypothetical protein
MVPREFLVIYLAANAAAIAILAAALLRPRAGSRPCSPARRRGGASA